jgi:2'-5' RNA ligase
MGLLRTFIAADIPPSIQNSIQHCVDDLRHTLGNSSVRWVSVHNIHLTLKFLGNISAVNVEDLARILPPEADSHAAFDISISGLGSFPNSKRARVLYIGIQPSAGLDALQRGIEAACGSAGFKSESRHFSPHLTIGRVRQRVSSSDQARIHKMLNETKIDSLGTARVDSIHLYKSERNAGGSVYTRLFSAPLGTVIAGEAQQ